MAKEKYQDAILQSISIIANQAVKQADYNKTIQATIVKCVDPTIEQYRVKYQDGYWYAYGNGSGVKYAEGSNVYILVPKGDMSENKIILGTVQKLGINYVNPISEENKYEETGNNVVTNVETSGQFGLCSYKKGGDSIILYEENGQNNKIKINNSALKQYIRTASHLSCSFKVRTDLNAQQKYKGKYGIRFIIIQRDATVGDSSAETSKNCIVDVDLMEGNPYNFQSAITQRIFLEINSDTFKRISKVELFSEGFPIEKEEQMPDDIFISSLAFQGMKLLSQEEMDTVALSFIARKGYIFEEGTTQTSLPIQAVVRAAGQVVNDTVQKVEYYWFIKNVGITASNPKYTKEGGQGWECINAFNIINGNVQYVPGRKTISIPIDDVKIKEKIYKCVIIYGNSKFSKEFTIINENADYDISISSDKGTVFETGLGKPTLTCTVLNKGIDKSNQFKYLWAITDQLGATFILQEENTNQIKYDVKDIIGFNIFSCTVIDLEGEVIDSAQITLVNKKTSDGGFSLIINNGKQVFSYDEQGVSPCKNKLINYVIPELSFTLYDRQGQKVDLDTVDATNITWSFVNNSVGILKNLVTDSKKLTAIYEIRDYYLTGAEGANISLEINYAGYRLSTTTDFTFTKEGYSGTNGTGIVARIVPIYKDINKNMMENCIYPILSDNSENTNFSKLRAQLYNNGEQITGLTCVWKVLKNNGDNSYISVTPKSQDSNEATVSRIKNNGTIIKIPSYKNPANIVQVTITYDFKKYYATLPILTADIPSNYLIYIKPGTGYDEVLYAEDGTYPAYNNKPFTFVIKNRTTGEDITPSSFTYTVGGNLNVPPSGAQSNGYKILPKTTFDGYGVNNYIRCQTKVGNNNIYLHIPIYQYLNRYGHGALNDWDGNSIQMGGSSGDIVLAPQIGAGSKDTNNAFTGILMGSVKPAGSNNKQDGLFGYAAGKRSIFLDANTGNATFGIKGNGRIIMKPNSGTIEGGNYSTSAKTGMQIDLKSPSITFGSGRFSVDKNGNLTAQGGGSIAGWSIWADKLSKGTVGLSSNNNPTSNKAFWAGNATPASAPFNVDFNGKVKMTNAIIGNTTDGNGDVVVKNGKIYTENLLGSNNKKQTHSAYGDTTEGFYIGSNGISLGPNFRVDNQGSLIVKTGYIGNGSSGFKINSNSITNGKTTATDGKNGIYLGTDAIALGPNQNFYVSNTGALMSTSGKIAGWNINANGLYTDETQPSYADNNGNVKKDEGQIFIGPAGIRLGKNFHVDNNGNLYANEGEFTGTIYASAGDIAGWSITASSLESKISKLKDKNGNVITNKSGKPIECQIKINGNGSMSGHNWSISQNGEATFNNIKVTNGEWSGGTISGGKRTGGRIAGGTIGGDDNHTPYISPTGVYCGEKGKNMNDWFVNRLQAKQAYIQKLAAEKIDAKFTNSFIVKCGGLKIGNTQYSPKTLKLPSGSIKILASENLSYGGIV